MEKWDDYFMIVEEWIEDGDIGSRYEYHLIIKNSKETIGKYKDQVYAIKQAKYKFKRISNRVEKILLG